MYWSTMGCYGNAIWCLLRVAMECRTLQESNLQYTRLAVYDIVHTLYIWHFTAVTVNPLPIYGKCMCIPYLWIFQCCQQKLLLDSESWGMWKSLPLPCPCWERNSINRPWLYTGPAHHVSEGRMTEHVDSWKLSHSRRLLPSSIVMKIQVSIVFPGHWNCS